MKKLFLIVGLLLMIPSIAQLQKTELTAEEITFLAVPKYRGFFGNTDEDSAIRMMEMNNTIFMYEVMYEGSILYTGTINKWNPNTSGSFSDMNRTNGNFSFLSRLIQPEDLLTLLENRKWQQLDLFGDKYIHNQSFDLFKRNGSEGYIINDPIPGKMILKFYKLTE